MIISDKLPVCFAQDDSFMDTALRKAELTCNLLIMIEVIPTTSVLFDLPHFLHTYLLTCQLYIPVPAAEDPPAAEPGPLSPSQRCCSSAGPQPCFRLIVWIPCLSLGPGLIPCCHLMLPGVPTGPIAVPPTLLPCLSLLVRALPVHVTATLSSQLADPIHGVSQISYTGLDVPSLSTSKATQDRVVFG